LGEGQVVVIGAGQAGLAVSHELTALGIDHLVLERSRIGQAWRSRWDSFCFVTPNWTRSLPGFPYTGDQPEGFDHRDEIVRYLERYAESFAAPVREGVAVSAVESRGGKFRLRTSAGEIWTRTLVLATGAYQRPHRPAAATGFPRGLLVIDAEGYTNPAALPPGPVLVVGSGQTGCQLSEELREAGRDVFLACGKAPWVPRRLGGRDLVTWLNETTWFETPLSALPSPAARLVANVQLSGRNGGHDLNHRVLQAIGVQLLGHLTGVEGNRAHFADDLAESVAFGDARYSDLCKLLKDQLPGLGFDVPELPQPPPFHVDPLTEVGLAGFGAVIFTSGFRPDYAKWVQLPAFDDLGFPITQDGTSTVVPGLFFVGVHFLRTRKSSLMFGVGDDARIVAGAIARREGAEALSDPGTSVGASH
jgi:putative flavoprotein involved in K+ transport